MILGSTFTIFLMGSWLQLSERFGPVIINVNRVFKDVGTIMLNYLVVLLAFSFGIYFVLKVNVIPLAYSEKDAKISMKEGNPEEVSFLVIWKTLWWALLNPGPDSDVFPEEGFAGTLTNVLYIAYQMFTIIMLLNLLIAMMNSTMQKIEDKRLTYWKYERTMIWTVFIDEIFIIPPPFSVFSTALQILFTLIFGTVYLVWCLYRKCKNKKEVTFSMISRENGIYLESNGSHRKSSKKYDCKMDPTEGKRRKTHAVLMKKLLNTLLEKRLNFGKGTGNYKETDISMMGDCKHCNS